MKKFILSLITLLLGFSVQAAHLDRQGKIDVLRRDLTKASSPADSVDILYNIYDLSPRAQQIEIARQLLNVAGRAHDYATQNDMIRQLATRLADSEDQMIQLRAQAAVIPNSVDKHITTMYLNHQLLTSQLQRWSENERKARLVEITATWKQGVGADIFDRLDRLYTIAAITGNATQGQLYIESLERMKLLMDSLPPEAWPLRNQCYTALANIYTNTDKYDLAIEADRKLLSNMEKLEYDYHKNGRPYRSYAYQKFLSYRRMISNYRALTVDEVKEIFHKIEDLAKVDPDVAATYKKYTRSRVYYLMGTKQYAEAIPHILTMLNDPDLSLNYRRQALRELRVAATVTGNDALLLRALKEYVEIIERFDSLRTSDNLNELSVRYEVSRLRDENLHLLSEAKNTHESHDRQMRNYYIIIILLLILIVGFLIVRHYRLHHHHKKIKEAIKGGESQSGTPTDKE